MMNRGIVGMDYHLGKIKIRIKDNPDKGKKFSDAGQFHSL